MVGRTGMVLIAAVVATGLADPSAADLLIASNFSGGAAGWPTGGPEGMVVTNVGGVYGDVLTDPDVGTAVDRRSVNTTQLPLELIIDFDYTITGATATDPLVLGFHLWGSTADPTSPVTGPLMDHNGYFLALTGGAPATQSLQLLRRNGPDPADLAIIGQTSWVTDDGQPHHLRLTDCGCGRLTVFGDDMTTAALYVDDKYNYIGRTGTYLGVEMPGLASGWIDNVTVEGEPVPEPTAMLLLLVGLLPVLRRR